MSSTISRKELIRKFKALGYSGPFSGGKHQFPNPHGSKNTHISLVKEILRQAGIKNDEWDKV